MNKKVLIFTSTTGHLSLAKAIYDILKKNNWRPELVDLINDQSGFSQNSKIFYKSFYLYFPFLFKIPFKFSQKEFLQKEIKKFLIKTYQRRIEEKIKQVRPDLVIATHFAYNAPLTNIPNRKIPFLNVVADPLSFHRLETESQADFNFIYDKQTIGMCQKLGVPKEKIKVSGWFVQSRFYNTSPDKRLLKILNFNPNVITVLICGGSEGANAILKILPILLITKKPLQIIVICGDNTTLFKALNSFKKTFAKIPTVLSKNNIKLKIIQKTTKMADFMALADLVIGKAGPNLLFETVASGKPFFAICHISGQEDGNLEIIKKKKLGFVEENPFGAIKLLQKIIENPKSLHRFQKEVIKERHRIQQAEKILMGTIKSLHLPSSRQNSKNIKTK